MKKDSPAKLTLLALACIVLAWCALRLVFSNTGVAGRAEVRSLESRLAASRQQMVKSSTQTEFRTVLREMKSALRQMSPREAAAWILSELEHGGDFATQLDFEIGADQNLAEWPTYRVFLLDMLMLVDPAAAAAKARDFLQASASADEWAVAMRNLARAGGLPEDDVLLKTKSAELLRNPEWRRQSSSGYLQAFDVIVHTRNTALAPELMALCDKQDQKAVRHAAFLTLDRLLLVRPEVVLPMLSRSASQHPQSGLMISNMMARGDLRNETQRQAIESYLLDEKRTPEELRGFASVFPNANVSVSNNLLTKAASINGAELAELDRAALEIVAAWLGNPAFSRSHPVLRETYQRLRRFVNP
ncbi:hypothetical protein [Prosthecobacter sp.]|uniref:hypothetical protein n=1 Tax=Prosthecobacter sp. TaxID=1965333 RepID=UPI003783519C